MGTRGRMEVWGSADIRTITHQQALKSLEETLIATKLTRIEFPRKVRHRRWSSWMIDGAIAGSAVTWVSLSLVLSSMHSRENMCQLVTFFGKKVHKLVCWSIWNLDIRLYWSTNQLGIGFIILPQINAHFGHLITSCEKCLFKSTSRVLLGKFLYQKWRANLPNELSEFYPPTVVTA